MALCPPNDPLGPLVPFPDADCCDLTFDGTAVTAANPLPVALDGGDIEIGAVEIKDGTANTRATVVVGSTAAVADNALVVADPNVLARLVLIDAGIPGGLGSALAAASMPVVIASDQVLALPTGASTAANQALEIAGLASIDAGIPAGLGQAVMAASMPVVIASDQSALPVSVAADTTAGVVTQPADVTVDATASGVVLLAANATRKSFTVENTGAANIRVRIDGDPTTTRGIQLAPGQSYSGSMPFCPQGAIKAIREGAVSSTAAVLEVV